MAFPRINCRTTTATVLTATATVTLCFVCVCASFCPISYRKSTRRQKQLSDFVETKKYWTLPKSCGSQSSEWEERKKSRAKRGSLCTRRGSRETVTCHGLRVVEPVYIRPCCAADGGAGGELQEGRASLAAVSFSRHIRLAPFLCSCAEPQTSREVEQDPCDTRPSFLIMCCVWESFFTRRR